MIPQGIPKSNNQSLWSSKESYQFEIFIMTLVTYIALTIFILRVAFSLVQLMIDKISFPKSNDLPLQQVIIVKTKKDEPNLSDLHAFANITKSSVNDNDEKSKIVAVVPCYEKAKIAWPVDHRKTQLTVKQGLRRTLPLEI
ncbi:unnamed protein product [Thelazia callipaeda]|uniref:Glycosyltransferase n=1 Tax=Thelazia callipaeda TaxID=103827 RepID=A0A0N5CKU7_THECL|nr:unnamed protein product [Thelazia callipaeda]